MDYWAKKSKSCLICRRLLRKNHFFREKSHKVPCIIAASWGEISFFGNFCSKTTMVMAKKVKLVLDMQAHFEEKITFFDRKVNKVICSIVAILGKSNFLGIFCVKTHWIIRQKSQNTRYADIRCILRKIYFFWEKSQ